MSLEDSLKKIKKFLRDRYKDNLAGILIFGSANIGNFVKGKSDIDHMIFLKEQKGLNLEKEGKTLIKELKSERLATQYFHTLSSIRDYLQQRSSFSTYLTIVAKDGSILLYTTPEFEKFRKHLKENPIPRNKIKDYLKRKDDVELYGYLKKIKGYSLTKAMMAHLRRKIQILNYFKTNKLIFDQEKCLKNINIEKDKRRKLEELYDIYEKRRKLSEKEIQDYHEIANKLTKQILKK